MQRTGVWPNATKKDTQYETEMRRKWFDRAVLLAGLLLLDLAILSHFCSSPEAFQILLTLFTGRSAEPQLYSDTVHCRSIPSAKLFTIAQHRLPYTTHALKKNKGNQAQGSHIYFVLDNDLATPLPQDL